MIIAIDFDGTIAKWAQFPNVGSPAPHALRVIDRLNKAGHDIYIWTVRDTDLGVFDAWDFLEEHKVTYRGFNILPNQKDYSRSPKMNADLFIDDKGLGCPLVVPELEAPYVDWLEVEKILIKQGVLNEEEVYEVVTESKEE